MFRVLQSASPIMTVFAVTPHSSGSLPFVELILPLEPAENFDLKKYFKI